MEIKKQGRQDQELMTSTLISLISEVRQPRKIERHGRGEERDGVVCRFGISPHHLSLSVC